MILPKAINWPKATIAIVMVALVLVA